MVRAWFDCSPRWTAHLLHESRGPDLRGRILQAVGVSDVHARGVYARLEWLGSNRHEIASDFVAQSVAGEKDRPVRKHVTAVW